MILLVAKLKSHVIHRNYVLQAATQLASLKFEGGSAPPPIVLQTVLKYTCNRLTEILCPRVCFDHTALSELTGKHDKLSY